MDEYHFISRLSNDEPVIVKLTICRGGKKQDTCNYRSLPSFFLPAFPKLKTLDGAV